MSYTIMIAGKGGTGKTTVAAIIVRLLKERKTGSILAVDADPNSNLAEALNIETKQTIGEILDEVARHPESVPSGMPKERFIEYKVQLAVQEADGIDLLTMGRPEGPGCYCYVNNVLRNMMGKLIKEYDYIVIDNEAGLEHLSRRTTRYADALVVVSNASSVGLKAAARIRNIVKELEIRTEKNFLIVNCNNNDIGKEQIVNLDLDYLGNIPFDDDLAKISLEGKSIMKLEDNAVSISSVRKIGDKLWL